MDATRVEPLRHCDAFNPLKNWYDSDVIGIDTGITMVMAENAHGLDSYGTPSCVTRKRNAVCERLGFNT